jgi:hypothetical protein
MVRESGRLRLSRHEADMADIGYAQTILVTKREGNNLRVDASIILKWTSISVEDVG